MKKTILVALDGSPRAPAVLTKAVELTRAQGAQLIMMRSVGVPARVPEDLWRQSDEPLEEVLKRRAEAYLAQCEDLVPIELGADEKVVVGAPWQAICDTARDVQAELIVIGSHGYDGLDPVIGTTAAKVVNHAPCSVLVVRDARTGEKPAEHAA